MGVSSGVGTRRGRDSRLLWSLGSVGGDKDDAGSFIIQCGLLTKTDFHRELAAAGKNLQ